MWRGAALPFVDAAFALTPTLTSSPDPDPKVVDNPSRLKAADWDRVVAVVALGKEWQFKGWQWSSPVELFSKCFGVYFKWDNEGAPEAVTKWNVSVVDVSRNRRNLDPSTALKFWQHLDNAVRLSHPALHRA